jgi:glutathione reductase (NADPH)
VHPRRAHEEEKAMSDFDAIVIGTGVAGQTVAEALATGGRRVAIVDRREYGGTCTLRGCEPKKVLVSAAEVVERARAQAGNGPAGELRLDWPALIAFKRTFTDPAPQSIEDYLKSVGVETLHGQARFTGPAALAVDGVAHVAKHFVVATGARPMPLGIEGEDLVSTSEDFMAAERLGERVVFIGGGYISMEFAHVAAAAGSSVTICHRGARVLGGFDPDLVGMLADSYRKAGIDVRTGAPVRSVAEEAGALVVVLQDGTRIPADMVVHGAGRAPDLEALDLAAAGVVFGRRGVEVDRSLRSVSNPRVWAAGDAADRGLPLTPVGTIEGRVLARNILGEEAVYDPSVTPSVVFSDPPLAMVGLTEAQAAERGLDVRGSLVDRTQWASSRRVGDPVAGAKVLVDRGTQRIVGAHLLGHQAEEVINVFATAMVAGLTTTDLKALPWAYPTGGWEIRYLV